MGNLNHKLSKAVHERASQLDIKVELCKDEHVLGPSHYSTIGTTLVLNEDEWNKGEHDDIQISLPAKYFSDDFEVDAAAYLESKDFNADDFLVFPIYDYSFASTTLDIEKLLDFKNHVRYVGFAVTEKRYIQPQIDSKLDIHSQAFANAAKQVVDNYLSDLYQYMEGNVYEICLCAEVGGVVASLGSIYEREGFNDIAMSMLESYGAGVL